MAVREGEEIAIEIETGKSDFIRNAKQVLLSKYSKIIIVATGKSALEKVELRLAKAEFIVPGRVEIVLGEETPGLTELL